VHKFQVFRERCLLWWRGEEGARERPGDLNGLAVFFVSHVGVLVCWCQTRPQDEEFDECVLLSSFQESQEKRKGMQRAAKRKRKRKRRKWGWRGGGCAFPPFVYFPGKRSRLKAVVMDASSEASAVGPPTPRTSSKSRPEVEEVAMMCPDCKNPNPNYREGDSPLLYHSSPVLSALPVVAAAAAVAAAGVPIAWGGWVGRLCLGGRDLHGLRDRAGRAYRGRALRVAQLLRQHRRPQPSKPHQRVALLGRACHRHRPGIGWPQQPGRS